jgi:predicted MFS family arabinose efflux permease
MRSKKPLTRTASITLEMACHTAMGVILGLGFSFALALMDSNLANLIAHSSDPKTATIIIVSFFTLAFGVGATLTGYVFTMMEER